MPLRKCFACFEFRSDNVVSRLDFSNTNLVEQFPNVWQFENTLEELNLSSTRINTLPPQLFYCLGLHVLILNNNNLSELPSAIGSLRNLVYLSASKNVLSKVPDTIKSCKNLTCLDLSCNSLQRLPEAITSLISLEELLLNEACLEFLPANFGRLVNLKVLELRLNSLLTLPKSMVRLSKLFRIDIGGNEFSELPEIVGELKQLRELWIDYNRIRRMSPNIGNLTELQHFEAKGNYLSALPNEICNWRNCELFSICTNSLETLPFSIGAMARLNTLKCQFCELCELPDSIAHLENLEELVVSHNRLVRLPKTIGLLKKLQFLFVDNNELRCLPDELCSCISLSVLSASCNRIQELPKNIGRLLNLKVINIVNNCIAYLPVSILSLTNLTSLWISENQSKPLVPLQYLNNSVKAHLTCFMLPQTQKTEELNRQSNDLAESKTEENQLLPARLVEPSTKRICFAENAITFSAASHQSDPVDSSRMLTTTNSFPILNDNMRLMRSPTPYPKELRQMAKYFQNNEHKVSPSHTTTTKQADIKAARVLFNKNLDYNNQNNLPSLYAEAEAEAEAVQQHINGHDELTNNNQMRSHGVVAADHLNTCAAAVDIAELTETDIDAPRTVFLQPLPPPYHIARNYTKKSPADLTNYESMRRLNQLKSSYMPPTTNHQVSLADNVNNSKNSYEDGAFEAQAVDNNIPDKMTENRKTFWLFGLHKNPTVKQASIKLDDNQLGFDIKQLPTCSNKNGIFVASVMPDTHAARVLNVDDKILEINGVDFTGITFAAARDVIATLQCGAIINIMFSRK